MRTPRLFLSVISLVFILAPAVALAQSNSKEIMAKKPAELIEILKDSNSTQFEKAKACQRLALVGTKDAIPALVALLPDEKMNLYARTALENIPGPEVDAALREAAKKLKGRQLVGVIDSIGQRRDTKAIELLAKFFGDKDPTVASAAAGALGRIGTQEAATSPTKPVTKNSPVKIAAADACLAGAEQLMADGEKEKAISACEVLMTHGSDLNLPKYIKVAALRGLFRLKGNKAKDILLEQIRSPDKAFFNVALAAAREMPGKELTNMLIGELEKLPLERRALLLLALADRKDPPELAVIVKESKSESEEVRKAAVYALVKRGDARAVDVLLGFALGSTEVARTAKEGLETVPGKEVDVAIIVRLDDAGVKAKPVLFELVGARGIAVAKPTVRRALSDADQTVRLAAIAAFGQLADPEDLELLAGRALADGPSAETTAAQSALRTAALRMGDREGCAAALATCLKGASVSVADRVYLLTLLGEVSGKKALATVVANVKSDNPAIKDAATRALGEWGNPDAAPVLLEIAKNDPEEKYRIRALRGYIRIARQLQPSAKARLNAFHAAMKVAQRNEEKRLALDVLTRVRSTTTLALAVSYLSEPALKDAAAEAAVRIAGKLVGRQPKAVAAAMRKVVEAGVGGETETRARQLLDRAGGAK